MPRELLVVDDEPRIVGALKTFFEKKGFHVSSASTIQAAIVQLTRTPAEIAFVDVQLPDGSGLDLLTLLKDRCPHLRTVVISCQSDQDTIKEALERGASSYLTKPFEFDRCFYAALGMPMVDLSEVDVQPNALACVPVALAQQYHVLPIRLSDTTLQLAMADPLDVQRLDELKMLLNHPIEPVAIIGGDLSEAMRRWYGVGAGVEGGPRSAPRASQAWETAAQARDDSVGSDGGVVRLVNDVIRQACLNRATDVHVGIGQAGPWVRQRIDGVLYDVPLSPQFASLYTTVISRFKVMANLDIAEHRVPQDGRAWFELGDTRLDLRLSIVPTPHGESLAIRLLEPSRAMRLDQIGMTEEQLRALAPLLAKPAGLLLVTGPTGSGKSTSLCTFLDRLNTGRAHIITIEDPIEHELAGVTQIQAQPKVGMTFATGLRSILRHDPDIIMVGEIRDQETASLAVRAALTGHLVLSTLHTNDAASGVTRLMDLGVEPFLLCSTLVGILSQRLIRCLCPGCKTSSTVEMTSLGPLGLPLSEQAGTVELAHAKGCKACHQTGYRGRTGVFELLVVDHHLRSLVLKRTSSAQLHRSAVSRGMQTLWQSGWQRALEGSTSLDELVRVLPQELR